MTLMPAALGAVVLCFLPFTTLFTWFTSDVEVNFTKLQKKYPATLWVTGWGEMRSKVETPGGVKEKTGERLDSDTRPEGLTITIVSSLFAVIALASCMLILLNYGRPQLDVATRAFLGAAMAGSMMMLVWFVGWVIKIVVLSRKMQAEAANSDTVGSVEMTVTISTMPGVGLYLAMGCSLVAGLCLSMALTNASKRVWAYAAQGAGLLLGLVVLAAVVQPWNIDALNKVVGVSTSAKF
jgi:hypothetical protein